MSSQQAQQQPPSQAPEQAAGQSAPTPSMHEMLRIMDVATALRRERETVQRELDAEEIKNHVRRQLLATAEITGEQVTVEEIDAAIDQYYDNLHSFAEPPASLAVSLAHLYIRRGRLLVITAAVAALLFGGWLMFFSSWSPLAIFGQANPPAGTPSGLVANVPLAHRWPLESQAACQRRASAALHRPRSVPIAPW